MAGELVRSAEEQATLRTDDERDAIYQADLRGEPCACGTEPGQICLAHFGLKGRRRHVRPGHGQVDHRLRKQHRGEGRRRPYEEAGDLVWDGR